MTARADTPPDVTSRSQDPAADRSVWGVAARPVAAVLGTLARLRSGPAIHAVGTSYAATVEVLGADVTGRPVGLPFVDDAGRYRASVRLSRAAGLPTALPDVLGFALRVEADGHEPQDLLLDSCWSGPLGRHLIRPGWSVPDAWYGSLLAYSAGDAVVHLAATGEPTEEAVGPEPGPGFDHDTATGRRFRLMLAGPLESDWSTWARVTLAEPVARPELRFSPAHDGLGIRLRADGTVFRVPSYRASQRAGPFD